MADKFEVINNYFTKIVKYHKNNLKVFSSVNNYLYTPNSKNKIVFISKIISYYKKEDKLVMKLINDFLELQKAIESFYNIEILKKDIFKENLPQFNQKDIFEIEEHILKYKPILLSIIENKYNRLVNFMIMNFQNDINLLTTIKNIINNSIETQNNENLDENNYCSIDFSNEENEEISNILNSDASKNEAIQKLIQWKQKINLFKSMSDEEIALIVRDVFFMSVKQMKLL